MAGKSSTGGCKVLALFSVMAGICGMIVSALMLLISSGSNDMAAGALGLLCGTILLGSGLISLSILSIAEARSNRPPGIYDEE